jgi:signal transduction histidine kinase
MVLSFALGVAAFVCLVTAITVGIGTLVIWVGIPILVATMLAWRWAAQFERLRIRLLLGVEIETPYRAPAERGLLRRLRTQVADPASWRDLLYLFLLFPVGIAELVVFTGGLGFALGLLATPLPGRAGDSIQLFGPRTAESLPATLVLCLLGILALVLVLNLFVGVAWLHARGARLLLGTSGGDRLRERVTVLADSRSRAVASALDERRQFERDVHDGAQQRLVALALDLGMAREKMEHDPEAARGLVEEAHEEAKRALAELRDLVRGVHPSVLTDRGLDAAVSALAARSPVPVTVRVAVPDRPPPAVESAAYFVVAEALANVAKHSGADHASVSIERQGGALVVEISDDGRGGADAEGNGLRGLADRVAALDGRFAVGGVRGTTIRAELPCVS